MATFYDAVYVTPTEVKENSVNADLISQTDAFINVLIIKAQLLIDENI